MCGFLSTFYTDDCRLSSDVFDSSLNFLSHRGPDGRGVISGANGKIKYRLGHQRLSIIDPLDRSSQPFSKNEAVLVYNGEIYNFKKLRKDIQLRHLVEFSTSSDTEVLFWGLYFEGAQFAKKLEGMFSFVFLAPKAKKIIVGRDLTGIKPLYVYATKNILAFSSEITPLQIHFNAFDVLDEQVFQFLKMGFSSPEDTLIKKINKISAGEIREYNLGNLTLLNNFSLHEAWLNEKGSNFHFVRQDLRKDLFRAVRNELVADVPVGVMLSGGLDSSLIALNAKKIISELNSFTIYFDNPEDEKFNFDYNLAKKYSQELGIKFNQVIISKGSELAYDYSKFFESIDEPMANPTSYLTYRASIVAKDLGVKVLLTGDGADEVFGGYYRYRHCQKVYAYRVFARLFKKYKDYLSDDPLVIYRRMYKVFDCLNKYDKFEKTIKYADEKLTRFLISRLPNFLNMKLAQRVNSLDFHWWLVDESNFRLDRASMIAGVEARVPFQNPNLVSKYFPISLSKKMDRNQGKIMLRKEFQEIPDYIKSPVKRGWEGPFSRWFREDLKTLVEDYLFDPMCQLKYFIPRENILQMIRHHQEGQYYKNEIRVLLGLAFWFQRQKKLKLDLPNEMRKS